MNLDSGPDSQKKASGFVFFVINFHAPHQVPDSEDGQGEEIHETARRADRVDRHAIRRSADRSGLPIGFTSSKKK